MKRFILVAVVVGVLAMALASTAFAAQTTPQAPVQGQGFGPGYGVHTPGTGLTQPGTGYGPRGGGMGMRGGAPAWAGQPAEVETLLGLTHEKIQEQRLAGKSLVEIAKEAKNIGKDELVSEILGAKKATLDQLVKDGKLDQPQADTVYSHMKQQVSTMVDRKTTGPAWRDGTNTGTRMGMRGRWNQ